MIRAQLRRLCRYPVSVTFILLVTVLLRGAGAPAKADPLVYKVPYVSHVAIDGNGADWGGSGLMIRTLIGVDAPTPAADRSSAQVRLGWDGRGLLVLADVTAPNITEAEKEDALYLGDSVEMFLTSARGSNNMTQVIVAPGFDPHHPKLRMHVYDRRSAANQKGPLTATVRSSRTPRGYRIEALLPWTDLGVRPEHGREVGFQIYVDSSGSQIGWYPQSGTYADDTKTNILRLDDNPNPPVNADAKLSVDRFTNYALDVVAPAEFTGQHVLVSDGVEAVGQGDLAAANGHAETTVMVPIASSVPRNALTLLIGANAFERIDLPDIAKMKQEAIKWQRLKFDSFAFSGDSFPPVDFEQPSLVQSLIGPYTIQTTFYDDNYNIVTAPSAPGRYGAKVEITAGDGKQRFTRYATLYRMPHALDATSDSLPLSPELLVQLGIDPTVAKACFRGLSRDYEGAAASDVLHNDRVAAAVAAMYEAKTPPAIGPDAAAQTWEYGLRKRTGGVVQYKYLSWLPAGYDSDRSKRWPLVLFLHGSGESGDDLNTVTNTGLPQEAASGRKFPFVLIAPQAPEPSGWNPPQVNDLLDDLMAKYRIDPDRVYVTGLSMGGIGAYYYATQYPERVAAIAPISGYGDPEYVGRMKDVPDWSFHGAVDPVVPLKTDQDTIAALRAAGGHPKFTVVPGGGHDIWVKIYHGNEIYDWLLQQRRPHPSP